MRIVQLTPGTGNFICGSCLRDNTLARGLRRLGHDVIVAPLYLPLVLEEPAEDDKVRLGGINVYLLQKLPWIRFLPRIVADRLDSPRLLRWAATRAGMTDPKGLGVLTLSMLRGEEGRQARELDKLVAWLATIDPPDLVLLSNALLCGLARRIKQELRCPVLCTLQGEPPFLDSLPQPQRDQCWSTLAERARDLDGFIAVSRFAADLMRERMQLDDERVHVVPNGIEPDGFEPRIGSRSVRPTIGYVARMCADKGLPTLVEAFLLLRERGRVPALRLCAGGVVLAQDRPLLENLRARVRAAGAEEAVEFRADLSRTEKIQLLQELSVLSVPATYGESFGLYLLEAMACGVPVVQPRHGAFPEILEATGGGVLYEPDDAQALALALEELLLDEERARRLGAHGREVVLRAFTAERMARDVERVCTMTAARERA